MSKYVNVAAVQFATKAASPASGPKAAVLGGLAESFERLKGYRLDLAVFSEAVEAAGQANDDAEDPASPGPFLNAYIRFAVSEKCHVAGSVKTAGGGKIYNSIAFITPEGRVAGVYSKVNLTIGELDEGLSPGAGAVVVDTAIGRLGGIICFDLNFDNVRRRYRELKPDILAFASAYHGGLMQKMWAYQCRSFFVSSCGVGSGILDPFGRPMALTHCYTTIARTTINLDRVMVHLDYNREKFPEIERKYIGEVQIDVPPNIGPALIYSLTEKRTAMDVVNEFKLELIDDYFARATRANDAKR